MRETSARIKAIRQALHMSQTEFGKEIGLSRDAISNIELERTEIKELSKALICRNFNVNPEWLDSGTGKMFLDVSKEDELAKWAGKVLSEETDSFRRRFVVALSTLNDHDWEVLEKLALKMVKK